MNSDNRRNSYSGVGRESNYNNTNNSANQRNSNKNVDSNNDKINSKNEQSNASEKNSEFGSNNDRSSKEEKGSFKRNSKIEPKDDKKQELVDGKGNSQIIENNKNVQKRNGQAPVAVVRGLVQQLGGGPSRCACVWFWDGSQNHTKTQRRGLPPFGGPSVFCCCFVPPTPPN